MQISNYTEMDAPTMRRYATFHLDQNRTLRSLRVLMVAVGVLLLLIATFWIRSTEFRIYCIVLLLLILVWFALFSRRGKRLEGTYAARGITAIRYLFEDDGFSVEVVSKGAAISERVPYTALKRAVETPDDFYLYIRMNACYIVSKHGFDDVPALADLRLRFSAQLGTKYKILGK